MGCRVDTGRILEVGLMLMIQAPVAGVKGEQAMIAAAIPHIHLFLSVLELLAANVKWAIILACWRVGSALLVNLAS